MVVTEGNGTICRMGYIHDTNIPLGMYLSAEYFHPHPWCPSWLIFVYTKKELHTPFIIKNK